MKKLLLPLIFCVFILDAFLIMFHYENYPWGFICVMVLVNIFLVLLGIALLYIIARIRTVFINLLNLIGVASSLTSILTGNKKTENPWHEDQKENFWFDDETED